MNCQKIQQLLLADYLDGEVSERIKHEVEGHLDLCCACRQFERAVQDAAIRPFKQARRIRPPDEVWNKLKEAIASEEQAAGAGFLANIWDVMQSIFSNPKLAFTILIMAIASLAIMVIAMDVYLNNQRVVKNSAHIEQPIKQVKYLSEIIGVSEYPSSDDEPSDEYDSHDGYGTAIEEYFL